MEGNLRLYDKIILGSMTVFALYMGIGSLFVHWPWGIVGTAFVFMGWSVVTRAYTYLYVENRPIKPGDIPEWDLPPEEAETSAAPEYGSRIIGTTAAGGEISEPSSKKWDNEESKENREIADMFRSLP
jgi:hypothetical protein